MLDEPCELDKEEYPLVGELAHQTGSCYCYLCTCKRHICPSSEKRSESRSLKGIYRTSYRRNYRMKKASPEVPIIREGAQLHSKNPMELKTSIQDFYPSYKTPPPRSYKLREDYRPSAFKLSSQSTYNHNYKKHKHYYTPIKPYALSYEPSPLKFAATTTYQNNFERKKPIDSHSIRSKTIQRDPVGVRNFSSMDTTNQRTFKVHTYKDFPAKKTVKEEDLCPVESPRVHFNTTYSGAFVKYSTKRPVLTQRQVHKMIHHDY